MTGHFHGRHRKGYMQSVREIKRTEANERAARTPEERAQRERERYELQEVVQLERVPLRGRN